LRHRPDRLFPGEVRAGGGGGRRFDQVLNTGHGGSLSTIHANDAESALVRLASCALQGSEDISWKVLCVQVAQAIDFVIHVGRREAVAHGARGTGARLRGADLRDAHLGGRSWTGPVGKELGCRGSRTPPCCRASRSGWSA